VVSPLESRLTARIAEATDESLRGIYLAELACYYARVGDFDRAESHRVELRSVFGDGRDLRVSVLIMTLEALLLYFRELSPAARDRLLRARLLCAAGKEHRLLALTSAWLAHIDFNLDRFDEMSESIALGIESLDADDGAAECRLALVLGDAFMYCEQRGSCQALVRPCSRFGNTTWRSSGDRRYDLQPCGSSSGQSSNGENCRTEPSH
jgi:hypothetical protein